MPWPDLSGSTTNKLTPGFGLQVDAAGWTSATASDSGLRQALARHGVVHLRRLLPGLDAFEDWTSSACPCFARHASPARSPAGTDGASWTDVHGLDAVPAHIERGYAFPVPEILFIYCRRPSDLGGEVTLHDGFEVYAALSADTRARLSRLRLRWRLRLNEPDWSAMFDTTDIVKALSRFHRQILAMPMLDSGSGIRASAEGRRLVFDYQTRATCRAERQPGEAVANSLLVYHRKHPGTGGSIELGDEEGRSLPGDLVAELRAAAASCAYTLPLAEGDLLCVDNRSVMHGRRSFGDASREVYVRAGFRASIALPRMRQFESSATTTPAFAQSQS